MLQSQAGEVLSEEFLPPLATELSVFRERKNNIQRMWHKKQKGSGMELEGGRMGEDLENYSVSYVYLKDQLKP